MKNKIVKILLSVAIVSLSVPIIPVFGTENNNLSAGIAKRTCEVLNHANEAEDPRYTAFTTANVNIRREPNIDSEIIEVVPFNTSISVLDYNDEWVVALWNEDTENNGCRNISYINKEYISGSGCPFNDYYLYGSNGFKSFMPYTAITNTASNQYKLQQNFAYTGTYGIRQVNGRYCVAIGTAFSTFVGSYFDLILENETVIPCIVSDLKSPKDTFQDNITTLENGCVSEFVVDIEVLNKTVKSRGDISSCCKEWNSPVKTIRIYDKNIFE